MQAFKTPVADQLHTLRAVIGLERLTALPGQAELGDDLIESILTEGGRFAEEVLAPTNRPGDLEGTRLADGAVHTARSFPASWARFTEAGWLGLPFPEGFGGQGLPWTIATALADGFNAANLAFYLAPLLTQGACEALLHHGSDELKDRYLTAMVTGASTGAMCLTEAQAGSDLGALRTRAVPAADGTYRITGQKIFITFGDHDLTDQVVHLVLARLPDAPPGSKGISLFLVPKLLPDGSRNDWRVAGLEHKLGIHGSPTCVIAYGDAGGATGWMIGEPNQGLRCMFTMMNNARLGVGVEGLGLAERACQAAVAYAQERRQGRRDGQLVPIAEHPDVARMLLDMRATTAAMRALCYFTAFQLDQGDRNLLSLLTPIVKAWCTDRAVEIASTGVQVHGGMGFIEETGAAQFYRDARILPIYEGTNGIQAQDLVARKLPLENGELPARLFRTIRARLPELAGGDAIGPAVDALDALTTALRAAEPDVQAAAATGYLQAMGDLLAGWLLAECARLPGTDHGQLATWWARRHLAGAAGWHQQVLDQAREVVRVD